MADREVVYDKRGGGKFISLLALVLSIIALALAWVTFNRTGEDLESKIQRQVDSAVETTRDNTQNTNPTTPSNNTNINTDTRGNGTPEDN